MMRKIICVLFLAFFGSQMAGCAALNYPTYAKKQSESIAAGENTKKAIAEALGKAVTSTDARTRDQASMALLVMGLTHKTPSIEAPREGFIERGLGAALQMAPIVGLAKVMGDAFEGSNQTTSSTNYNQTISGQGAGGAINVGSGSAVSSPATSPPTVVYQPEPVIVGD